MFLRSVVATNILLTHRSLPLSIPVPYSWPFVSAAPDGPGNQNPHPWRTRSKVSKFGIASFEKVEVVSLTR